MLILCRKKGQRIFINNGEIVITLLNIVHGQVRIGFEASKDVIIHREEVHKENLFVNKYAKSDELLRSCKLK